MPAWSWEVDGVPGLHPGQDPTVVFAFWLGVAVLAVTVLMLFIIIVMRQVVSYRERRHLSAVARWSGLLASTPTGSLPALPTREAAGFVAAWLSRATRGEGNLESLRAAAQRVGLEKHLHAFLRRGDFNDRSAAITAMGYLGNAGDFDRISPFLGDQSPVLSLGAASALMRLDAGRAVSLFMPQIIRRHDWARGRVAAILNDTRDEQVAKALSEATLQANSALAPRLVRFLAGVSPEEASNVIRTILRSSPDHHLISTCLQVIGRPSDLDLVRPMLSHERWHVRMHAATALGRLGGPGDEEALIRLLSDRQWWVRYRAAQALTQLPFLDEQRLYAIGQAQTDRFAVDILGQVLAEKTLWTGG